MSAHNQSIACAQNLNSLVKDMGAYGLQFPLSITLTASDGSTFRREFDRSRGIQDWFDKCVDTGRPFPIMVCICDRPFVKFHGVIVSGTGVD